MLPAPLSRRRPALFLAACVLSSSLTAEDRGVYQPSWSSLNRHQAGSWFPAARLGLAVQWGVASVPGQSRDYARLMYLPSEPAKPNPVWAYHQKHYGHPSVFGYKDLLPYFEAKAWRPAELARLFKDSGAGYVIVLGTDRDNIDLFASTHHDWNTARFGPRRNLAAEWVTALRAEGLKAGVALHNGRAWDFLRPAQGAEWEGPHADKPFDGLQTPAEGEAEWWRGLDPRDLYGKPRPGNALVPMPVAPSAGAWGPDRLYQENWYKRAAELVTQTTPDVLYVEGGLPHGEWGLRLAAHFFTTIDQGRRDLVKGCILIVQPPQGASSRSYVAASERPLPNAPWQAEFALARDGIRTDQPPTTDAAGLLAKLAETASTGGNLLVRIALREEGTLPEDQAAVLREVGTWLGKHGRSLLGTRAGPKLTVGNGIRGVVATRKDERVFVFIPQWPGTRNIPITGLTQPRELRWCDGTPVASRLEGNTLVIQPPARQPDEKLPYLELVDNGSGFVD